MSMRTKTTATIVIGGVVLAIGATTAIRGEGPSSANNQSQASSGQTVHDGKNDYQAWATQVVEDQLAQDRADDEAFDKLLPAEQQRILRTLHAKAQLESNALTQTMDSTNTPSDMCPSRGVLDMASNSAIPMPFHGWEFIVSNYWGGVVNGVCEGIYSGYDPTNPMQGELVIWDFGIGPWQYYPSPTATGPLTILAEEGGSLKLASLKGTYYTSILRPPQRPV